ncbi:MAG: hypothetical protein ACMG6E_03075, partial [Candidatus Roizmanbacteria bacterium]
RRNYSKAKLVIQEVNGTSIHEPSSIETLIDNKENLKDNKPLDDGVIVTEMMEEESLAQVLQKEPAARSEARVIISDTKKIVAPTKPSAPKDIASAIKSAFRSTAKSEHDSTKKSPVVPAPALSSTIRVIDPIDSTQHRLQSKPEGSGVKTDEDGDGPPLAADMMPKTDAEKLLYWKTKLQILKKSFRDVTIPKNNEDLAWRELRKMYYIERDRVSINKNVDSYKLIMIVLFFIFEWVGSKFLKINISGFAVHSIKSLHRYDRLLVELGEKSYGGFGENWPVEIRLGGLVLVNAIIFCIAKYVFKYTGQDSSDAFYEIFSNLGNESIEIPEGAGLDAPNPNDKTAADGGNTNGIMGLLSGLLGSMGGGNTGGGGGGGMDMISSLLGAFTGGIGKTGTAPKKSGGSDKGKEEEGPEEGSRIRKPKYRRKSKAKPVV